MSFSNRNKIGIKWLRRNHKELRCGFVTDSEKQKYGIPRSWKNELKRISKFSLKFKEFEKTLLRIEEKNIEYFEIAEKAGKLDKEYIEKEQKF